MNGIFGAANLRYHLHRWWMCDEQLDILWLQLRSRCLNGEHHSCCLILTLLLDFPGWHSSFNGIFGAANLRYHLHRWWMCDEQLDILWLQLRSRCLNGEHHSCCLILTLLLDFPGWHSSFNGIFGAANLRYHLHRWRMCDE